MDVRTYPEPQDFLAMAGALLQSDEVRYGLIYGIARRVAANPHYYGEGDPWFCTVAGDADISALAWRTPPHPVGLAWHAGDVEQAVALLINAVRDRWQEIPGVTGHKEVTELFSLKWCEISGNSVQSTMAQRTYRLDRIGAVPHISGRLRQATPADEHLVSGWVRAFNADVYGGPSPDPPEIDIAPRIEKGEIYLWEDNGELVCMAAKTRPTEHGMAIGLVYTPPELRRRGLATACVAGVCREVLKSGYDFCTLYTDLSNPTSNSIYTKIGFKPVCDSIEYRFRKTGPP